MGAESRAVGCFCRTVERRRTGRAGWFEDARRLSSICALELAIITAAYEVKQQLGPVLEFGGTGKPSEPEILLYYELTYILRLCLAKTPSA
jgi:hypothetical protein